MFSVSFEGVALWSLVSNFPEPYAFVALQLQSAKHWHDNCISKNVENKFNNLKLFNITLKKRLISPQGQYGLCVQLLIYLSS